MSADRPRREDEERSLTAPSIAQDGLLGGLREVLTILSGVAVLGLVLFVISGAWPPLIAVESGSMEPNMHKGDMTFITAPGRFPPEAARGETGVVTSRVGREVGHRSFGGYGSVVVYEHPGVGSRIIHRARFWVEEGENWYDEADPAHIGAENCRELPNCPAPHAGFITKGDANSLYDQAYGADITPVRPEWIIGIVRVRTPYLGWVRLVLT